MESPATAKLECTRCKELERLLAAANQHIAMLEAKLEQRVLALTEQIQQLKAENKKLIEKADIANLASKRNAAPFRKSPAKKKPKENHKKPGRPEGHPPANRETPQQADRTVDATVSRCPDCNVELVQVETHEQFQIDLPQIKPVITKFHVQVGRCPSCGKRVQGTHPDQSSQAIGAANQSVGPNALALATALKYSFGLPFRKISKLFRRWLNLKITHSAIVQFSQRISEKMSGVKTLIELQLSSRKAVHADETGWWNGGEKAYLHTFCSRDLVVYKVGDRSADVAKSVLGQDFSNTLCCDGYVAYDVFKTSRCNAHIIRRVRELLELPTKRLDRKSLILIKSYLQQGIALSDKRTEMDPIAYAESAWQLQKQINAWVWKNVGNACAQTARLARHLRRYQSEFFAYLSDPEIPATNNEAERMIRPAVLLRKVGCCNRSSRGVRAFETLASVLGTLEKKAIDFGGFVKHLVVGVEPKFVPDGLLPSDFPFKVQLNQ